MADETSETSPSESDSSESGASASEGEVCLALPEDVSAYEVDYSPWYPPEGEDCSVFPATPAESLLSGCFPLCAPTIARTVQECGEDFDCYLDALLNDPTEPAMIEGEPFGCLDCYDYQFISCQYESCPEQTAAADECFFALDNPDDYDVECAEQDATLRQCLFVDQFVPYQRCYEIRVPHCAGITPVERTGA